MCTGCSVYLAVQLEYALLLGMVAPDDPSMATAPPCAVLPVHQLPQLAPLLGHPRTHGALADVMAQLLGQVGRSRVLVATEICGPSSRCVCELARAPLPRAGLTTRLRAWKGPL